jgi:exosortase
MGLLNSNIELTDVRVPGAHVSSFRVLGLLLVCTLPFALAWNLTESLAALVLNNDTFSQIPLIPLVSIFLIYEHRKTIFATISASWILGTALFIPGLILLSTARLNLWHLSSANPISLFMFATVLIWLGAFALLFGYKAFRAACFPLLFLLFVVPIPEPFLSKIIYFLQAGSSDMSEAFFRLAGVPYHREGFVFELPGVAIRVAEECSGIRSTLALLITTILASYIFLKSPSRRLILCVAVVPTAIFKNGLRIATLSVLSIYVDKGFLYGNLHHRGGIVFFIIALLPLALLLKLLQKSEKPVPAKRAYEGARIP